jgi:hypothetical protein
MCAQAAHQMNEQLLAMADIAFERSYEVDGRVPENLATMLRSGQDLGK